MREALSGPWRHFCRRPAVSGTGALLRLSLHFGKESYTTPKTSPPHKIAKTLPLLFGTRAWLPPTRGVSPRNCQIVVATRDSRGHGDTAPAPFTILKTLRENRSFMQVSRHSEETNPDNPAQSQCESIYESFRAQKKRRLKKRRKKKKVSSSHGNTLKKSMPAMDSQSEMSREQFLRARRKRYVLLLQSGFNSTLAAVMVGVSKQTAKAWRNGRSRGNSKRTPPCLDACDLKERKPSEFKNRYDPKYLRFEERVSIYIQLHEGKSHRDIARSLGRHHSAISREIAKNTDFRGGGTYTPFRAENRFREKLLRPKKSKIGRNAALWIRILKMLNEFWSPMQISSYLRETNPDNPDMQLSHESIYRAIYVQEEVRLEWKLRQCGGGRVSRKIREEAMRARFKESMVNISQRPAEANDRATPGHWEGDLIIGKGNKTAIGTLVERSTRFCILLHLPNGYAAYEVQKELVKKMRDLPGQLRKTLVWDQGSELALHARISEELGMQVFFCDPHSPWQRGTNENTNGLLRQYFPKGADLSVYTGEDLDKAANSLNNRPRLSLGWKSPAQKFSEVQGIFSPAPPEILLTVPGD